MNSNIIRDIVRIHINVFPDLINTRLGEEYLHFLFEWFSQSDEAVALSALENRMVAGYVIGAPFGYQTSLNRWLSLVTMKSVIKQPELLLSRKFLERFTEKISSLFVQKTNEAILLHLAPPTMYLLEIAVSSAFWGRGIANRLLTEFEMESLNRGMKSMELSVSRENYRARELYEKAGWKCELYPEDKERQGIHYYKIL